MLEVFRKICLLTVFIVTVFFIITLSATIMVFMAMITPLVLSLIPYILVGLVVYNMKHEQVEENVEIDVNKEEELLIGNELFERILELKARFRESSEANSQTNNQLIKILNQVDRVITYEETSESLYNYNGKFTDVLKEDFISLRNFIYGNINDIIFYLNLKDINNEEIYEVIERMIMENEEALEMLDNNINESKAILLKEVIKDKEIELRTISYQCEATSRIISSMITTY